MPTTAASPFPTLTLAASVHAEMVAACLAGYPLEACGLLGGHPDGESALATACYPAPNVAASSRVYTVEPRAMLRADRAAEDAGLSVLGVWHSHTHTDAYPSPTDIGQAPDPDWWYVLVSLRDVEPVVRAYRIRDGAVVERPIALQ
ncbi:M67 family metallopeptidase [Acidiferrimicrobium sp. IK]|uniref:M67 family metallopeptidase n=1 Tax=Acidiferrimicrobium sp. IK TaxID=2871700 RepID=UPI0021CB6152|nr:M67 family metallopeptidase [Acidiferrimicrobium sp. IK]MCU4185620.1 M67 family metallopeptidase [Acidiferrimicrobium sp. IK]